MLDVLFKPEHVAAILEGTKTQTRRLGRRRWNVGSVHGCTTRLFAPPFAHVLITDVRQQRLDRITTADARAEGYPSRRAFLKAWDRIVGEPRDVVVWVVRFERVEHPAARHQPHEDGRS